MPIPITASEQFVGAVYGEMEIFPDMYFLDLRLGFNFQIKTGLPQWELAAGVDLDHLFC